MNKYEDKRVTPWGLRVHVMFSKGMQFTWAVLFVLNQIKVEFSMKFTSRDLSLKRTPSKKQSGVFGVKINVVTKYVCSCYWDQNELWLNTHLTKNNTHYLIYIWASKHNTPHSHGYGQQHKDHSGIGAQLHLHYQKYNTIVVHVDRRERSKVPYIVRQCIEEVEKRGIDEVGIYRISGVATDIQALKTAFDTSKTSLAVYIFPSIIWTGAP